MPMPSARTHGWRVATRLIGHKDWDIGRTPMTASNAQAVAKQLNRVYPNYQHEAVRADDLPRGRRKA